ncbi:hypothetical protein ULF88_23915 [Halopseudomonas pachastrellae]|nr:hypothetical protein [Halopseudomonas pachastrellae]
MPAEEVRHAVPVYGSSGCRIVVVCLDWPARPLCRGGPDDFVTARNSQNARAIGLSFLASGMGGWILFAPPEVGALVGPLALAGYALGAALPFALFAALGPAIRRALPQGRSIGEFAEHFYGPAVRRWVGLISLLYMSCFLIAELTAIGAITSMLSDINGTWWWWALP